ncbi:MULTISPECIES: hypothetical protein [unclassified Lysinibacillus]|uniref:hypothetical protein n=1 Tax=unclassified Lysinibacillus TaxID=2636778 RepID=UPI00381F23A2
MIIITYGLIGAYALLTGLAGLLQWKEKGYQRRSLLFVILSTSILLTIWIPYKEWILKLLILEFIMLHLLAIIEGLLTNNKLRYSHHIIRFIFHCILLILVSKFMKY